MGGVGLRGDGRGGGDSNVLYTKTTNRTAGYLMLDSRISFRFFKYKCCLGLSLSPGAKFHARGKENRGSLLTNSTVLDADT